MGAAKRFYVYELIDPRDGAIFYVGKGCRNRIDDHEKEARSGWLSAKCDMIRDIESDGVRVIKHRVASFADEGAAYAFEATLIDEYGLDNLTNQRPGGGGIRGIPSLYDDRSAVAGIAQVLRRLHGKPMHISLYGVAIDFTQAVAQFQDLLCKIVERRGSEWVNGVSMRHGLAVI